MSKKPENKTRQDYKTAAAAADEDGLRWCRGRGLRLRSADLELPRVFFLPASWGLWALVASGGDVAAVGSRGAPGWLAEFRRRLLREHLLTISPTLSLRSVEKEEEALLGKFIELASAIVDGYWAYRGGAELCARLVPIVAEATAGLHALTKPLVKRLAASKDPFEKEMWRLMRRSNLD